MATKYSLTITLTINNVAKKVISIARRPNGDLIIANHGRLFARDRGLSAEIRDQGSALHNLRIREDKISIHMSPHSPHGINDINFTLVLENGKKDRYYLHTLAIKKGVRFEFLFFRTLPTLVEDRFSAHVPAEKNWSLGKQKPSLMTAFVGLFIGGRDAVFYALPQSDLNVEVRKIGDFSIVTIWSFIGMPSTRDGFNIFGYSFSEEEQKNERVASEGCDPRQVLEMFRAARADAFSELFQTIISRDQWPAMEHLRKDFEVYSKIGVPDLVMDAHFKGILAKAALLGKLHKGK